MFQFRHILNYAGESYHIVAASFHFKNIPLQILTLYEDPPHSMNDCPYLPLPKAK